MKGKPKPLTGQKNLFGMNLADTLDQRHDPYLLANAIDWDSLDDSFSPLYSNNGRPSHPVRRMAGLLILKQLRGLSDPGVCRFWHASVG